MIRVNFTPKTEEGNYIVEDVCDKGLLRGKIEVKPDELPLLMKELSDESGSDKMLDALRFCYQHLEMEKVEFYDRTDS